MFKAHAHSFIWVHIEAKYLQLLVPGYVAEIQNKHVFLQEALDHLSVIECQMDIVSFLLFSKNVKPFSFIRSIDCTLFSIYFLNTGSNDKIVVLKKTTLQLYFKTFIEKINSGNLIM